MRVEPKLPKPIDMSDELQKLVHSEVAEQGFAPERKRSQFAILGHQAIDARVSAAEEVVRKAQAELDSVKERAEGMRRDFDARDAEIQTMLNRVTDFGKDQLNAHAKFSDGNSGGSS